MNQNMASLTEDIHPNHRGEKFGVAQMKTWIPGDLMTSFRARNPSLKSSSSQVKMTAVKGHQSSCISSYI